MQLTAATRLAAVLCFGIACGCTDNGDKSTASSYAPETDLASYRASVARLAALVPELKAVFPAHNTPRADPALLLELRDRLEQVLAGEIAPTSSSDGAVEFQFRDFGFLVREDYYRIAND